MKSCSVISVTEWDVRWVTWKYWVLHVCGVCGRAQQRALGIVNGGVRENSANERKRRTTAASGRKNEHLLMFNLRTQ